VDRSEGKLKNAMRRVTTILKKEEGKVYDDLYCLVMTNASYL
jgi:hypothetical protein